MTLRKTGEIIVNDPVAVGLQTRWGLTKAQARTLEALRTFAGTTPKRNELALTLKISPGTLNNNLNAILLRAAQNGEQITDTDMLRRFARISGGLEP